MPIYSKQTWVGASDPLAGAPGATPLSDTRLNHIEDGIYDASVAADGALDIAGLETVLVAGSNLTIDYDEVEGTYTFSATGGGGTAPVTSVNTKTGAVVLNADDLADGTSKVQMTTAERTKLSGVAAGAQVNTVTSVAGRTGAVTLAKADVGLSNVDNTSDASKPVSTATQTALNSKANTSDLAAKANTADLAAVATSGAYTDLTGRPTLGTAAASNTGDFATAAQGALAATAVQPAALANYVPTTRTVNGQALSSNITLSASDVGAGAATVAVNAQTGAYTLVLADAGKAVEVTSATAVTITVPTNASVAYPVGTLIEVAQTGVGQVTIAGAGVTLQSPASLKSRTQYSTIVLRKRATDTWIVGGDLE